ncbi:ATP-binding protein [Bailinhaonella thermotolerans]|uniref:LuxR family transcriptional regulator n=1 Tax=Bailinhaonella thermotolerans TaxID=1070861 RepID=A0A3A4AM83_9ACTN|nr:LuxR C-terminal-related transcriptional regulator [Bailinhaonella thermotolerans]RJL30766.1 LuxR family transcriptional regulator [Bailinhaonella thermotolerans]
MTATAVSEQAREKAGNLPAEVTSFIGRGDELAALKRLIETARLVTVTGVGGVGKTRIALRAATELRDAFPDGVWFVELSGLREPELLAHTVGNVLGIPDQSTRPHAEVLAEWLEGRRLLLILDTCEHVVDAGAALAETLLRAAPGLRVLATSRQPLDVPGEHTLVLAPLPVPGPDHEGAGLSSFPSLALFAERASAVVPGFALDERNVKAVAALCHRLDGIPLAIELAAVRRRAFSVEQILERLDDRFRILSRGSRSSFPRHQTLRTAIGWSHELCDEEERRLWARLSVFSGGFDLAAAEDVCSGPGLDEDMIYEHLAGLVDKSIVVCEEDADGVRYRLLDVIREYGADWLADLGEEHEIRRRHRDHYLRRAEEVEEAWVGSEQFRLMRWLNRNLGNLRSALEFCLEDPGDPAEVDAGLGLVSYLWPCWIPGGQLREGRRWLERFLAIPGDTTWFRTRAWWVLGSLAAVQGDLRRAAQALEAVRVFAESHPEMRVGAYVDQLDGTAAGFGGDLARGVEKLTAAVETYPEAKVAHSTWHSARLMSAATLALLLTAAGETERADSVLDALDEECEAAGERWIDSYGHSARAFLLALQGRGGEARRQARLALRRLLEFRDALGLALCLDALTLAALAGDDGENPERSGEQAAFLLGFGDTVWRGFGDPRFSWASLIAIREHAEQRARAALGDAAFDAAYQRGARAERSEAAEYALGRPRPSPAGNPLAPLTPREQEIALLVAEGLSNREIAERLVIAKRTADSHVEHILAKLGFSTRAQIAAWVAARRR